ncbi:MAG: polysaccharide biosynthesis/export family protein [Chromatiales bacterium]|nr:polysaccharide biosynthesis/export family protein [Chromatiales bacterium]
MRIAQLIARPCAALLLALGLAAPALAEDNTRPAYLINPGDVLTVSVWKEPELERAVIVRPDGGFSFPLAGQIQAEGRSIQEVQDILTERLDRYIPEPVVTLSLAEIRGNKIYVIGQVQRPGEFLVNTNVDVMQALSMAGGGTPFAQLNNVRILRREGGRQVAIPFRFDDVVRGRDLEQNILLQAGDTVVVP